MENKLKKAIGSDLQNIQFVVQTTLSIVESRRVLNAIGEATKIGRKLTPQRNSHEEDLLGALRVVDDLITYVHRKLEAEC